ncbi:MAG: hypothetical protein KJ626_05785 [Verrucomicrobia bacterium]|nr:hypothetical protein [Verrucomicrobiota bacterium]
MIVKLNATQQKWVNDTLASLSTEDRLAQLMVPVLVGDFEGPVARRVLDFAEQHQLGSIFLFQGTPHEQRRRIERVQKEVAIPLLVAADLECGSGHIVEGHVKFPDPLALAAAGDEKLAYMTGKGAGLEGRSVGINWTYAPVADVNVNPDNPIACTRSLGDDPELVARLAKAVARGMQDHGIAACAKHFPGDGVDDLDQHAVTSVNSLSMDDWRRISGRAFKELVDDGVWSIMIGHIALPAWHDDKDYRGAYCPASVSEPIVTGLLRKELGFEGLIVTDDMNMGGVAGYMNREDRTIACIAAGCDTLLFPRLPDDYDALVRAVHDGRLSEERVTDACRRVLEMKARLGLPDDGLFGREATPREREELESASVTISRNAICKVRDFAGLLPLRNLQPGSKVITITLRSENQELPVIDEELGRRGYDVVHLVNPDDTMLFEELMKYGAVFLNFVFPACWATQSVRSVGPHNRMFLNGFFMEHPCCIFTSFGSPYHLRMFNTLPDYINVHSACPASQKAAVEAWFGDIPMDGRSPVGNLTRDV